MAKAPARMEVRALDAFFGAVHAVRGVSMRIPEHHVTAVIGPSGCGKSTFLRTLNRLHETVPGARVRGRVLLGGEDIYEAEVDPVALRRRVGMVFQRSTAFPTMSIRGNVAAGLRVLRSVGRRVDEEARVKTALRRAALWTEVRDRLDDSALDLSGGQQQRLCIARALA
ncbi:MAG TPA: ATP-binding cassette domain-containing protein, partial [Actinomycetota bacterium]|nr:ATP-binding cassette domain-containing protein [Actinomycetota bacterium]